MRVSYLDLVRDNPRALAFGFMHATAATIGQTFVIALFLPDVKRDIGLSDAAVAGFFTVATLASAAALSWIGRWIDRFDLLRYSLASAAVLSAGCVLAAFAGTAPLFLLALFLLRLGGNGLLNHIALTATARHFTAGRGKALSLVASGFSVGEAALGVAVVFLLGAWGRRATLVAVGILALVLAVAAVALVGGDSSMRRPEHRAVTLDGVNPPPLRARHARGVLLLLTPLYLATPLIVTAFVFHQGVLAAAKGFTLEWFAVSFVAFAVSRVISGLAVGPAIDRYGSTLLFVLHLAPFCAGLAVLAAGSGAWIVPAYWVLTGITGGFAATLQVAVLAEYVQPSRLGRARSAFGSLMIVAAATGPALYGGLIELGAAVETLLWGSIAAMAGATLLGAFALRRGKLRARQS